MMENGAPTSSEDTMTSSSSTTMRETISRLASKPGVVFTVVLDRSTSTVLQSGGTLSSLRPSDGRPRSTSSPPSSTDDPINTEEESLRSFASKIWNYVNSTAGLVGSIDSEDDLKLLRLRTKKYELVIVPDTKFIFVVAHEVPTA